MRQTMRHEIKYILDKKDYIVLKSRLEKLLNKDPNAIDGHYTITSLYFDAITDDALRQKIEGDPIRHKYRLRYYNNDLGHANLERKSKIHQMTSKDKIALLSDQLASYEDKGFFHLSQDHAGEFILFNEKLKKGHVEPKVWVQYEREAYLYPMGDVRITFDHNVRSSPTMGPLADKRHYTPTLPHGSVVMEVKFNGILPRFITACIQTNQVMARSSSKYVVSRLGH